PPVGDLASLSPVVEATRAEHLEALDHRREARLATALRPREECPTEETFASLRPDPVRLDDEAGELVVQLDRLALHIARAVNKEVLDPVDGRETEREKLVSRHSRRRSGSGRGGRSRPCLGCAALRPSAALRR